MPRLFFNNSDALSYLGLAKKLLSQMSPGKKTVRIDSVTISLSKGDIDCIRITSEKPSTKAYLLIGLYHIGDTVFSFWKVDYKGNVEIMSIPKANIDNSTFLCGAFDLADPSIVYLAFRHASDVLKDWSVSAICTCESEYETKGYCFTYKLTLDFKNQRIDVTNHDKFLVEHSYRYDNRWSFCNHYLSCWSDSATMKYPYGKEYYLERRISDIYAEGGSIQYLYKEEREEYEYYHVDTNTWDEQYDPNVEVKGIKTIVKQIKFGSSGIMLENSNLTYYVNANDTGVGVHWDIITFDEPSIFRVVNVEDCKSLSRDEFIYAYHPPNDKTLMTVGTNKQIYQANIRVPYLKDRRGRLQGYTILPSVALKRKSGKSSVVTNLRYISYYSWAWLIFDSESIFKWSQIEDKHSQGRYLLGFSHPKDEDKFFGIEVSDAPDYGYGGLAWSNPLYWDGFYLLPFTTWDKHTLGNIKWYKRKDYGMLLPNPLFRDCLVVPKSSYLGFYTFPRDAPGDFGARSIIDLVVLLKVDNKWYINGDDLGDTVNDILDMEG